MPRLALALALACAALSVPAEAEACANSMMADAYRRLRRAEDALDDGHYQRAARLARRELVRLADDDEAAAHRARRILALAAVRSRGAVPIDRGIGGASSRARAAAIAWSIEVLRKQRSVAIETHVDCALDRARCHDGLSPIANAELAEALARAPDGRDEAHTLLDALAVADLMPSPEAWAALAGLRGRRGDVAGQEVAAARCRRIAARPTQCVPA